MWLVTVALGSCAGVGPTIPPELLQEALPSPSQPVLGFCYRSELRGVFPMAADIGDLSVGFRP